jgi:hypothetical protein
MRVSSKSDAATPASWLLWLKYSLTRERIECMFEASLIGTGSRGLRSLTKMVLAKDGRATLSRP